MKIRLDKFLPEVTNNDYTNVVTLYANPKVIEVHTALDKEKASYLATLVKNKPEFKEMHLSPSTLSKEAGEVLGRMLAETETLKSILIKEIKLCTEATTFLTKGIAENKILTTVKLDRTDLDDEGIRWLAQALITNPTLASLILIDNKISKENWKIFAQELTVSKTLTSLEIEDDMGDEEAIELAQALRENKKLKSLVIRGNIGDVGAQALASALEENDTIESLVIRGNVGDEGAIAFAQALRKNKTLTSLAIWGNVGDDGAIALAQMLRTNTTLIVLNVYDRNNAGINAIGKKSVREFVLALKENKNLAKLNLSSAHIDDEDAKKFASVLKENRALISLNVSNGHMNRAGFNAFLLALETNKTIVELYLPTHKLQETILGRLFSDDIARRLEQLLARNKQNLKRITTAFLKDGETFLKDELREDFYIMLAHLRGKSSAISVEERTVIIKEVDAILQLKVDESTHKMITEALFNGIMEYLGQDIKPVSLSEELKVGSGQKTRSDNIMSASSSSISHLSPVAFSFIDKLKKLYLEKTQYKAEIPARDLFDYLPNNSSSSPATFELQVDEDDELVQKLSAYYLQKAHPVEK